MGCGPDVFTSPSLAPGRPVSLTLSHRALRSCQQLPHWSLCDRRSEVAHRASLVGSAGERRAWGRLRFLPSSPSRRPFSAGDVLCGPARGPSANGVMVVGVDSSRFRVPALGGRGASGGSGRAGRAASPMKRAPRARPAVKGSILLCFHTFGSARGRHGQGGAVKRGFVRPAGRRRVTSGMSPDVLTYERGSGAIWPGGRGRRAAEQSGLFVAPPSPPPSLLV